MENKLSKRSIVIGITSLLLVTLLLLGLTYAYYKTRIDGNTNEKSVSVTSKKLEVTYIDGSSELSTSGNIEPGFEYEKEFTVTNTGSETVNYSIILDNIENTFTRDQDWEYTLTKGGSEVATGTIAVGTHQVLIGSETLESGSQTYMLKVTYVNSDEDQSDDMGQKMSFRVNISDETQTWDTAKSGTLLYAIKNNGADILVENSDTTVFQVFSYKESELSTETNHFSVNSCNSDFEYFVYGTGYTFDETSGLYTLTGVTTTTDIYQNSYSELEGKYVAYSSCDTINASTKEAALKMNTDELKTIYKIINIDDMGFNYLTKTNITDGTSEISSIQDDYGTSYVYRGNVTNNYVNYSGMCWRIVRVQGDGTIKLTLADENGECDANTYSVSNSKSAFIKGNTEIWYLKSVTYESSDWLFENTKVLSELNSWVTNKIIDISKLVNTEWCIDTTVISNDSENLYYGGYERLVISNPIKPTLKCNMKGRKGTTGIEANAQKYTGKIALLTADEVALGNSYLETNARYINNHGNDVPYWTLTPYSMDTAFDFYPIIYAALGSGLTRHNAQADPGAVRPAVVLNSNVEISSGNGTQTNPYVVN